MNFPTSNAPIQTLNLGQHVHLHVHLLLNPSCNFKTLSRYIQFESKPQPNNLTTSIWRASSIPSPIYNGITSILLFHFFSTESNISKCQVTLKPHDPKTLEISKVSQESNPPPLKLDINELSKQKHYYATFKFLSKIEGTPKIDISWEYLFSTAKSPQKNMSSGESMLRFDVSSPFYSELKVAKVRNEGVLLEVTLSNISKYIVRDVKLEVNPSSHYVVDESELSIADVLLPSSHVSGVYPLELQRGEGTFSTKILESLTVKWSTGFEENCSMQLSLRELETQTESSSPVAISMIGSPQMQKMLTPFAVKFDIHNTTAEERKFVINVDSDNEVGLMPFGIHVFTTDLLPAKGSQRIVMEFIGLKQGLLSYPELIISTANFDEFRIDPENGVLILADDSYPE